MNETKPNSNPNRPLAGERVAVRSSVLFGEKMSITPNTISNISGQYSLDLAVTTGLATAPKLYPPNTQNTRKIIRAHP